MDRQNVILWILQIGFGVFFLYTGVIHLVVPEGLPEVISWMYDLSDPVHIMAGTAEILGGLGLILPGVTRIATWLTPLAAAGLVVLMLGAVVWHLGREEYREIVTNLVGAGLMSYVAYARWRIRPLPTRSAD